MEKDTLRIVTFILPHLLSAALAAMPGCGGTGAGGAPQDLPAPGVPGKADEAYAIEGARQWYLIGNDLTPGHDRLDLSVTAPAGTEAIDLWIDRSYEGRALVGEGPTAVGADLGGLEPGPHEALLAADEQPVAFAQLLFILSHPMYVLVTTDWDDPDNRDDTLTRQEDLHERHPDMKITHFVGPYTFTDPGVTADRASFLASWAAGMRDLYGDEIGLHIHPYCSFVEDAGLSCRTSPSFAYAAGDSTGYTVRLSSYSEEETRAMLDRAAEIFEVNGLGRPTSFRAGGWTAEIHTLKALAVAGYAADTSGCNWERLEEWRDVSGADLYSWNQEHWVSIDETSQPYYPSADDILMSRPPVVPVLEVPDNGILVDYVSADEMIEMFHANWEEGSALERPAAYVTGYHPPNFSVTFFDRVDALLGHVDRFLYARDAGPAVYETLSSMAVVWKPEG